MKFTPDSKFMHFCSRLVELTCINLLWMLCCLPVFTIGASTTAMITALYAYRGDEPCGAKVFFRAFRQCFGKATVLWLLMLLPVAVMTALMVMNVAVEMVGAFGAIIGVVYFAYTFQRGKAVARFEKKFSK